MCPEKFSSVCQEDRKDFILLFDHSEFLLKEEQSVWNYSWSTELLFLS